MARVTFEVRASCARGSDAGTELDRLAFEGEKQIRPNTIGAFGSVAAHFATGGKGQGRNRLRRGGTIGEGYPANV